MMPRAVALLSGGLDSTLATKVVLQQGIEVFGFHGVMPWGCCDKRYAVASAAFLEIPLMTCKLGDDYIQIVRKPRFGYGSGMNPCVDCRIYLWDLAKKYMEKIQAGFLITGEVLGQRPMSQIKRSLKIIEEESGLVGKILRPLSAKLLPPTLPEIEGAVDRNQLLGLEGRTRKEQIRLAREFGLKNYPTPAGGCLLTDKSFAEKVKDHFAHTQENSTEDFELLTLGRHFRVDDKTKVILGRNEQENYTLQWYAQPQNRHLLVPKNFVGPFVLIDGEMTELSKQKAADLAIRYTRPDRRPHQRAVFEYRNQAIEVLISDVQEELSVGNLEQVGV